MLGSIDADYHGLDEEGGPEADSLAMRRAQGTRLVRRGHAFMNNCGCRSWWRTNRKRGKTGRLRRLGMGMGLMAAGRKLGPYAYGYQKKREETLVTRICVMSPFQCLMSFLLRLIDDQLNDER